MKLASQKIYLQNYHFGGRPIVLFGTNKFINTDVILKYDDIDLIALKNRSKIGYRSEIKIYHPDGTYLANINGNRVFGNENAKKANITIDQPEAGLVVCKMAGRTILELKRGTGENFKDDSTLESITPFLEIQAELYTNDGQLLTFAESQTDGFNVLNKLFIKNSTLNKPIIVHKDFSITI